MTRKTIFFMVDGDSSEPKKTASEALLAKEAGITLFAIGVGRQVNFPQLRDIASSPEYAFRVNNYEALESIKEKLAIKTCEGSNNLLPSTEPFYFAFISHEQN